MKSENGIFSIWKYAITGVLPFFCHKNLAGNTILQTYVRDATIFYTNRLWKGAADGKHFMCQYSGTND
jgi:hypothetical protein